MAITAAQVKELRERTGAAMMACKKALQGTDGDVEAAITALREAGVVKAAKRAGKVASEGRVGLAVADDKKSAFIVEINSETDFVSRADDFIVFLKNVVALGLAAKAKDIAMLSQLEYEAGKTIEDARQALVQKIGENVQLRRCATLESEGVVAQYLHGDRIGVLLALDQEKADLARDVAMHVAATNPAAISADDIPKELLDKEREIFTTQAKESGKPDDIIEKMVVGRINKFLKENSLLGQPFVKNPDQTIENLLKAEQSKVLQLVRYEVGEGIEKEEQDFAQEVMAQVKGNE